MCAETLLYTTKWSRKSESCVSAHNGNILVFRITYFSNLIIMVHFHEKKYYQPIHHSYSFADNITWMLITTLKTHNKEKKFWKELVIWGIFYWGLTIYKFRIFMHHSSCIRRGNIDRYNQLKEIIIVHKCLLYLYWSKTDPMGLEMVPLLTYIFLRFCQIIQGWWMMMNEFNQTILTIKLLK